MTEKKEKPILTSSVTIGAKVYSLSYDANGVKEPPLTEKQFDRVWATLGFSMAWALREEGKMVNPGVRD